MGGLQSILQQSTDLVKQLLGEALGMVKSYMLYGLHGFSDLQPQQVFPAKLSVCDIRPTEVRDGRSIKVCNLENGERLFNINKMSYIEILRDVKMFPFQQLLFNV